MSEPAMSLRERSKAKRRETIRREAMRLFTERGFEGATIQDIADAAELAPRTVTMYYPSKLDIALSWTNETAQRLVATFREHPDAEFTDVVGIWLEREKQAADPELVALALAMLEANPALSAVSDGQVNEAMHVAGASLTTQMRLEPGDPLFAVACAAVHGAITEYIKSTSRPAAQPDAQDAFLTYLRAIIETAHTASTRTQRP